MAAKNDETLLYFAFGSNLSSTQMRARCPGAAAVGLAFLPGYDFIINERGYANVGPRTTTTTTSSSSSSATAVVDHDADASSSSSSGVYGVLYRLASPAEKRRLDGYEGVPLAYEDLVLDVELLVVVPAPPPAGEEEDGASGGTARQRQRALVYVDRQRVTPAAPRDEYVARMNRGIEEAVAEWGLPGGYVRDVMRRYIPSAAADDDDDDDETAGGGGG
ncbi:hypothetical protein Daus18300_008588 [Diaporthe australafricana]|uniref:gamma-glutamylcyclotransferase n=1 Tax=Diaporthe australafricana TaxID=127596 RepID=A0ABR3WHY3_9PEZI